MTNEIKNIFTEIETIKNVFNNLIKLIPSFDITNKEILPYGLKPHTRSVSWIVEQVVVQQAKFRAKTLKIHDVNFNLPDTCLHDCEININGKIYFVNVKIHNIEGKENKNDISAVEKLYAQYKANPNYNLLYACFGIRFENVTITFDSKNVLVFSPQFLPIYINPRNDKIQALYNHKLEIRSRKAFLNLLVQQSKNIRL